MAYFSSLTYLNNRYGTTNVQIMADLDGSNNAGNITARINDALLNADAWVYGHLRKSLYSHKLPTIVDRDGNVPRDLILCATMFAGFDLLRPRGFRDFDKEGRPMNHLYYDLLWAEQQMAKIAAGTSYLMDVET